MKKKILLIFLIVLFLVGCSGKIKVYIDPELSKEGVDIWEQNVKYVELSDFGHPDVYIYLVEKIIIDGRESIRLGNYDNGFCYDTIEVTMNNPVLIAHEFGHFLGYEHSKDTDSIMYNPLIHPSWPLTNFKEFR